MWSFFWKQFSAKMGYFLGGRGQPSQSNCFCLTENYYASFWSTFCFGVVWRLTWFSPQIQKNECTLSHKQPVCIRHLVLREKSALVSFVLYSLDIIFAIMPRLPYFSNNGWVIHESVCVVIAIIVCWIGMPGNVPGTLAVDCVTMNIVCSDCFLRG